jgi:dienelactone hydrolase
MRSLAIISAAAFAIGWAAPAGAQTTGVEVGSYSDFGQLMTHQAPQAATSVAMKLRFPARQQDRSPAIVVVHTLGGYRVVNEGWHAAAFREAGFATLTYDSAAARRIREGDAMGAWPSAIAEAYGALRLLADNPAIDAHRIAIAGFSYGGEVAHLSALERLRSALASGQQRFAAHVAYYPAGVFGAIAEPGAYTGAPILMLLGDKDDNLPIAKVQDYLAYAKATGGAPPVQVSIYPGAYHAWTVSGLGAATFYPQYASMRKCPYLLLGAGPLTSLVDGQPRRIDPSAMQACRAAGQGYSMAYDEAARAASLRDVLAFLSRTLKPD